MTAKTIAEHFQDGIDLFNAGRFFECHEAWEQAWLRSAGADKLFYQGMIQAAAAILHAQRVICRAAGRCGPRLSTN